MGSGLCMMTIELSVMQVLDIVANALLKDEASPSPSNMFANPFCIS